MRIDSVRAGGGGKELAISELCVTKGPGGRSLRSSNRVNRGGSGWNNDAANCRTANRNTNDPDEPHEQQRLPPGPELSCGMALLIVLRLQKEQIVFRSGQVRT